MDENEVYNSNYAVVWNTSAKFVGKIRKKKSDATVNYTQMVEHAGFVVLKHNLVIRLFLSFMFNKLL